MDAKRAIEIISLAKSYMGQPDDYCSINLSVDDKNEIAALIERQQAEIAKLKKEAEAFGLAKKVEEMAQEIAKKDRMIDRLIDKLIEDIAECPSAGNCPVNFDGKSDDESNAVCRACWLAWLEKEAEVQHD